MAGTDLIAELSRDLEPAQRPLPIAAAAVLWLAVSWLLVAAFTVATGPMRPEFDAQLSSSPRFALEWGVGALATAGSVIAALRLGLPGLAPMRRILVPALALLGLWLAIALYAVADPVFAPSMLGKRPRCFGEILAFGVAPFALGIALLRRMLPLHRSASGAVLGAAAAGVPALLMQLACMYDPSHALMFHLGPVALAALAGAAAGPRLLPGL